MTFFARLKAWGIWDVALGLLVFSWPITRFLKTNGEKLFSSADLLLLFLGFCVIFGSVAFFFRRQKKVVLSVLLFFLCFFTFVDFCVTIEQSFPTFIKFYQSYGGRLIFFWFALIAGLMWSVWRLPSFIKIAIPFLWVFVTVSWIEILPSLLTKRESVFVTDPLFSNLTLKHKPNIYFLMIDGYPGEKTLRDVMNTTGLAPLLRKKGFVVPRDTRSNYHFTLFSLSSQFQMNYHQPRNGFFGYSLFSYPVVGRNNFVRALQSNGYSFLFAPGGWYSEFTCRGFEQVCLSPAQSVEAFDVFKSMTLLNYTPHLTGTYLEPASVELFVRQPRAKPPYFVFAHFFQIHDLVYTKNGKAQEKIFSGHVYDQKSCRKFKKIQDDFDQRIIKLVACIQQQDPQAVILISSDHGVMTKIPWSTYDDSYRCWSSGEGISAYEMDTRFQNLIALYVPPDLLAENTIQKYFYDGTSNVNTFRGILALLTGEKIPALPDRHFVVSQDETKGLYFVKREHKT